MVLSLSWTIRLVFVCRSSVDIYSCTLTNLISLCIACLLYVWNYKCRSKTRSFFFISEGCSDSAELFVTGKMCILSTSRIWRQFSQYIFSGDHRPPHWLHECSKRISRYCRWEKIIPGKRKKQVLLKSWWHEQIERAPGARPLLNKTKKLKKYLSVTIVWKYMLKLHLSHIRF